MRSNRIEPIFLSFYNIRIYNWENPVAGIDRGVWRWQSQKVKEMEMKF